MKVHPRPLLAAFVRCLCPAPQVRTFKMARKAPFSELRRVVAEEMGVPADKQRFWRWSMRQNGTYRPSQVLRLESEDQPISVSSTGWLGF